MGGLLDPSSYQLRLLSATSGASALALLVGLVSVALMRGASGLRAWLLATTAALLVCATWSAIGLSADDPAAATTIARLGAALLPLAAGTGTCFQLTLIGELRGRAWLGALLVLVGVAWVPIIAMTDLVVDGAAPAARGVLAGTAGPAALPALVYSAGVSALGLGWLGVAIRRAPGQAQRRQWSRMWWASLAIALGTAATIVVDEQTGVPVGWLLLGGGTLAVLGALWFDDLLRVRAIDTRLPLLLTYVAFAALVGWAALELVMAGLPTWAAAPVLIAVFLAARLGVAGALMLLRGGARAPAPLERIVDQFAQRAAVVTSEAEAWAMARDTIELATGIRATMLRPRELRPGLVALALPVEVRLLARDELELALDAPARREVLAQLDAAGAAALVPAREGGELEAMIVVPSGDEARLHRAERQFLIELAPRLGTALVLARVAAQARERVAAQRDLELAAAVQTGFVPPFGLHHLTGLTLAGVWQPASRCSGDFWTFYDLGRGRTLLAIGDVTGHGVGAALVTAAAKGAADVAVRGSRGDPSPAVVAALDAAVRRVGAGRLQMTCGVALLDPQVGLARVHAAGHGSPLRLRRGPDGATELTPMLAHGNPLGTAAPLGAPTEHALAIGDVVVWYSDGLTECEDERGTQFGERRLLRVLRAMPPHQLTVEAVRDAIMDAVGQFRGGAAQPDDLTLLVAEVTA